MQNQQEIFRDEKVEAYRGDKHPFLFISYAHADTKEVQEILGIMKRNHFCFWYDEGIRSGTAWGDEIVRHIDACEQFVVILSKNAVLSENIKDEVHVAVNHKKAICVIYLEPVVLEGMLELKLDRKQAVKKYEYKEFSMELCKVLDKKTLMMNALLTASAAKKAVEENYEIQEIVEDYGWIGRDYLARDKRNGRQVLIRYSAADDSDIGREAGSRRNNEKRILEKLTEINCPFVPHLLDCRQDGNGIYLIESYIQGKPIESLRDTWDEKTAVHVGVQVLNILRYLHKNNIIHRAVTPDNLLIDEMGGVFLTNFSDSRIIERSFEEEEKYNYSLLGVGEECLASEQKTRSKEKHTDFTTDICCLGKAILSLFISADEIIFWNETADIIAYDSTEKIKISLRYLRKEISPVFEKIVQKMTEEEQRERYQSADEVLAAFSAAEKAGLMEKIRLRIKSDWNVLCFGMHYGS